VTAARLSDSSNPLMTSGFSTARSTLDRVLARCALLPFFARAKLRERERSPVKTCTTCVCPLQPDNDDAAGPRQPSRWPSTQRQTALLDPSARCCPFRLMDTDVWSPQMAFSTAAELFCIGGSAILKPTRGGRSRVAGLYFMQRSVPAAGSGRSREPEHVY
jgi:hypothetical protein